LQEMVRKRSTMLTVYTPGILLRSADVAAVRAAQYKRDRELGRLAGMLEEQAGAPLTQEQRAALLAEDRPGNSRGQQHACGHGCDHHH
jgi:hypothetical protein